MWLAASSISIIYFITRPRPCAAATEGLDRGNVINAHGCYLVELNSLAEEQLSRYLHVSIYIYVPSEKP